MLDPAYRDDVPPGEWPVPGSAWLEPDAWAEGEAVEPIRVLVAEDAPSVRRALAALLAAEPGVELVGTAEDAVEAIELARRELPDVAIVDAKMPGGGGARAAREILLHSPSTVIVALSAHGDRENVLQMLDAGAVEYILKGTPAHEILSAIDRLRPGLRV
jgi:DNA-binding NarL/FixJ family response regulator